MPRSLRVALVVAALTLATTSGALAAEQPSDADQAAGGQQTDTAIQKPGHVKPGYWRDAPER